MASFIFANDKIRSQRNRYHTPATFRAQKRLLFTNPTPLSTPAAAATGNPPPPGVSSPRVSPTAFSATNNVQISVHPHPHFAFTNFQPQYILPWDTPGSKTDTLFKISPPKLKHSAGSRDEEINKRFLKKINMYLFSNFQVHKVLVGDRPHPFLGYDRLAEYWRQQDIQDWKFDTTKTSSML